MKQFDRLELLGIPAVANCAANKLHRIMTFKRHMGVSFRMFGLKYVMKGYYID